MIYVASSWRNPLQRSVVQALRAAGHDCYDFREPEPGVRGFNWSDIDPDWQTWSAEQLVEALKHPIAVEGFGRDMAALRACDVCVLVMPCGRSAHLELGQAVGAGKRAAVLLDGTAPSSGPCRGTGQPTHPLASRATVNCPWCSQQLGRKPTPGKQEVLPAHDAFEKGSPMSEPELMWAMADWLGADLDDLIAWLDS